MCHGRRSVPYARSLVLFATTQCIYYVLCALWTLSLISSERSRDRPLPVHTQRIFIEPNNNGGRNIVDNTQHTNWNIVFFPLFLSFLCLRVLSSFWSLMCSRSLASLDIRLLTLVAAAVCIVHLASTHFCGAWGMNARWCTSIKCIRSEFEPERALPSSFSPSASVSSAQTRDTKMKQNNCTSKVCAHERSY